MSQTKLLRNLLIGLICLTVAACGLKNSKDNRYPEETRKTKSRIGDLLKTQDDPNVTLRVNKYLWVASLDVLDFMPIEAADPFTGTISLGYGVPRGSNRAYRATIFITDPALDARSLRVALQARDGGQVSTETARAIEDAILTRARQLRIDDTNL